MESKNVLLNVVKVRTVSNHILILELRMAKNASSTRSPIWTKNLFHA